MWKEIDWNRNCFLLLHQQKENEKEVRQSDFPFLIKICAVSCRFMLQLLLTSRRKDIIISEAGIPIQTCFSLLLMGECIFAWILLDTRCISAIDLQCLVAWLDSITKLSYTTSHRWDERDISKWKRIFWRHWHKLELAKKINQRKFASFTF